jgi:hypothetical protein
MTLQESRNEQVARDVHRIADSLERIADAVDLVTAVLLKPRGEAPKAPPKDRGFRW